MNINKNIRAGGKKRKETHHVLVDQLDHGVLHVEARVFRKSLGDDHHRLRVGLDA